MWDYINRLRNHMAVDHERFIEDRLVSNVETAANDSEAYWEEEISQVTNAVVRDASYAELLESLHGRSGIVDSSIPDGNSDDVLFGEEPSAYADGAEYLLDNVSSQNVVAVKAVEVYTENDVMTCQYLAALSGDGWKDVQMNAIPCEHTVEGDTVESRIHTTIHTGAEELLDRGHYSPG